VRSADEQTARKRWQRQYIVRQSQVFAEIEHEVFGSDYGATSWTDRAEAEAFARFLRLGPNTRALEVGAGSGWPGVYLSALTGCDLTLIDVPEEGLHRASSRASADGIGNRCRAIVADGSQLPLRDRQFEAIYHCDVLC